MSTINTRNNKYPFSNLTRREFLRFFSLGLVGLMLPDGLRENVTFRSPQKTFLGLLGRVAQPDQKLFAAPDQDSKLIAELAMDDLYKITGVTVSKNYDSANRIWYQLEGGGFAHSRFIQPVYRRENHTNTIIPEGGCLGEITVPYADAYKQMDKESPVVFRLYYASTFWILTREVDQTGQAWYQILDDRHYNSFYVPAVNLRLVSSAELSPISPSVPWDEKRIDVNLETQTMTAYEGETVVYMARISSGKISREGGVVTPRGYYRTTRKRPCRHMVYPANDTFTGYDLPGVPWVSYFTGAGIAFHGTYWHNNFGVPHSHGCINLSPRAAKWVYLWTTPAVPPDKYVHSDNLGTRVFIH
jgi:hypothetical protein